MGPTASQAGEHCRGCSDEPVTEVLIAYTDGSVVSCGAQLAVR